MIPWQGQTLVYYVACRKCPFSFFALTSQCVQVFHWHFCCNAKDSRHLLLFMNFWQWEVGNSFDNERNFLVTWIVTLLFTPLEWQMVVLRSALHECSLNKRSIQFHHIFFIYSFFSINRISISRVNIFCCLYFTVSWDFCYLILNRCIKITQNK